MKIASLIPPALLIAGLSVSGCDGLDNPSEIVNQPKDFNGAYNFDAYQAVPDPITNEKDECNFTGSITLFDGDVSGDIVDQTGEKIKLNGSVDRLGVIEGDFYYPRGNVTGPADFNGKYSFSAIATDIPENAHEDACGFAIGSILLEDGVVSSDGLFDQNSGEAITLDGSINALGSVAGDFFYSSGNAGTYSGDISTSGNIDGTWDDTEGCRGTWEAELITPTYSGVMFTDGTGNGIWSWKDGIHDCSGTWDAAK